MPFCCLAVDAADGAVRALVLLKWCCLVVQANPGGLGSCIAKKTSRSRMSFSFQDQQLCFFHYCSRVLNRKSKHLPHLVVPSKRETFQGYPQEQVKRCSQKMQHTCIVLPKPKKLNISIYHGIPCLKIYDLHSHSVSPRNKNERGR